MANPDKEKYLKMAQKVYSDKNEPEFTEHPKLRLAAIVSFFIALIYLIFQITSSFVH